jgi:hypothetical protein
MSSSTDFPARGKIIEVRDAIVVFQPSNTNYQLHLEFTGDPKPEVSAQPIECFIRVEARKVYTVPSGGNFIQPIFGPPRIIQGRVKYADPQTIVVQAGTPIICQLPAADSAIDLSEGKIRVGHMANVVALPGARIELATIAEETIARR